MVRADERFKKEFPLITLPVLILRGSQHFYDMAGSPDKTLKLYEGFSRPS
jgi:acylglycerol lipase